jgi:hypothetical protein
MPEAEIEIANDIKWNTRLEEYFAQTGEKAHCFSWLHKRSEEIYSKKTVFIDLPVIILGVLNGATSIGSQSLFGDSKYASVGIGIVALLTSILSTIGSYFSWSRRAESHKISSLQYAKLYRFLSIEMSLPRHERMSPADLLKYTREQYDRFSETSPLIPPIVIDLFRQRFSNPIYKDITFPEETNGLHAIEIYRDFTKPPSPSDRASHRGLPPISVAGVGLTVEVPESPKPTLHELNPYLPKPVVPHDE